MLMQTFPSQFWVGGKRLGRKRRGGETSVIPCKLGICVDSDMCRMHGSSRLRLKQNANPDLQNKAKSLQMNLFRNTFKKNIKVISIPCASEHICSIVRYCFRSFKQL